MSSSTIPKDSYIITNQESYPLDLHNTSSASNAFNITNDLEKKDQFIQEDVISIVDSTEDYSLPFYIKFLSYFSSAETKGIEPINDDEKNDTDVLNAASMWFSANMVIASFALGVLGPMVFKLNFVPSLCVIIFFNILGMLSVAFFSLFGIELGLRQMILSRFLLGNITARIFCIINMVACVGWCIVNTITSAQLLYIIGSTGHKLPPWAGCLIIMLLTMIISIFGYKIIHTYEKYSWVPNFAVFLVIIARLSHSNSFVMNSDNLGADVGNVLSFGSVVFGFAAGWTTYASDYTTYMPRSTNKIKVFTFLLAGLAFPLFFTMILGAACAMGTQTNTTWLQNYSDHSVGGLLYSILVQDSLHGFGSFCCVLLALSTVANNIPNMYTIALSAQATTPLFNRVPRVIWTLIGSAISIGISIPAYYSFDSVMTSFMDSIGYYLAIYIAIALSEHFIYRKGSFKNYKIEYWNDKNNLPVGIAGTTALIAGAFGVAIGMSQTYWSGEIARLIGKHGGDIGFELGAGFALVTFNTIRPLEKRYFKR